MTLNKNFILILIITILTSIVSLPKNLNFKPIEFSLFKKNIKISYTAPEIHIGKAPKGFHRDLVIKRGLDLQGGTQLVLRAEMKDLEESDKQSAIESAKEIITRRVDMYGVGEPNIQTSKVGEDYRILVELPGVDDVTAAIELVGKTAQLDFRELPDELKESTQASILDFVPTGLTGKELKRASVQFGTGTSGEPVVSLEFTNEGKDLFAQITKRNIGHPVGIFLDEMPVTLPKVNDEIVNGQAIISGDFTTDSAKELMIQLNAGALPVPIQIIEQRTIGPSLGQESIDKSVKAGGIGLLMVMVFMIIMYGKLGIIADVGLVIYGLVTLAIYKLIPVTLTLPGIAGFILTVGMAVDSNILIFERMKEELRNDRPWNTAMELGFGRAWDSIKDANIATIIIGLILLNPLDINWLVTSGMLKGFALTLLLGVFISMFTGIYVSRVLIRMFFRKKE